MNRALALLAMVVAAGACSSRHRGAEEPSYEQAMAQVAAQQQRVSWTVSKQRMMEALPRVEQDILAEFTRNRMPSLVAGILIDGQLVWWRGYGVRDLEQGGSVDPHTVYRIGSVTKVITALAMLRLRDEGKVSLDAPAAEVMPELAEVIYPTAERVPITFRHLLTHTSGLPRLGAFDYAAPRDEPVSEREILAAVRTTRLESTPGTVNTYSNFGYALLGIMAGRLAGTSYREYVTREILTPLGMASAAWDIGAVPRDRLATGYVDDGGYKESHDWLMGAAEGMGGLYASLDDLVRFVAFEMTAWPPGARPDQPPARNATVRESHMVLGFHPPQLTATSAGWSLAHVGPGLGHSVQHSGATAKYAAHVSFLPQVRIGFVGLTSCGELSGVLDGMAQRSLRLLAQQSGQGTPSRLRVRR